MKYSLDFEIAGLPKLTNQLAGRHWRAKNGEALKWFGKIMVATGRNKPDKPLKKATLVLTRYSSMEPDTDGLCGGFKHVIDALVKSGILENDKPSNIGSPVYLWEKTKQGAGKIRVRVEEA